MADEEKLQIARRFILAAPAGEINEVIADVKTLLGSSPSIDSHLPTFMREYNHANLSVIKSADGDKVITCAEGQSKDNTYVDHLSGKAFEVNHAKSEIVASSNIEHVDPTVEQFRSSAQDAIAKYTKSALSDGYGVVHGSLTADGQISIFIAISGVKLNSRNFWNGRWTSSFTAVFPASGDGGGQATLTGLTRILVHYYEEGNVQLETKRQHALPIQWGPGGFGAAVAKAAQAAEADAHGWVDRTYGSLSDTAFKALRRKIPRTQTKFQWDKVAAYSLGKELAGK